MGSCLKRTTVKRDYFDRQGYFHRTDVLEFCRKINMITYICFPYFFIQFGTCESSFQFYKDLRPKLHVISFKSNFMQRKLYRDHNFFGSSDLSPPYNSRELLIRLNYSQLNIWYKYNVFIRKKSCLESYLSISNIDQSNPTS